MCWTGFRLQMEWKHWSHVLKSSKSRRKTCLQLVITSSFSCSLVSRKFLYSGKWLKCMVICCAYDTIFVYHLLDISRMISDKPIHCHLICGLDNSWTVVLWTLNSGVRLEMFFKIVSAKWTVHESSCHELSSLQIGWPSDISVSKINSVSVTVLCVIGPFKFP